MTETCIINYATGGPDSVFGRGQQRLVEECKAVGYEGDFILFNEGAPLSCPSHAQVPYAFKPYAIKAAADMGYRLLLWCDSSVYPVRPLDGAFEIMNELGYMFFPGGYNTGQWCSDEALEPLGVTREEAFEIPHMVAGCQGLDMSSAKARHYLNRYYQLANDGVTFAGNRAGKRFDRNHNHEVSDDDRVLGHRHDQTAASVVAWKLGMRDWKPNVLMYLEKNDPIRDGVIFVVKGI
jgi:hypothetical protein